MTALPEPIRPTRRRLPSAPSPSVFEDHVEALRAQLNGLVDDYEWLHPSGYHKARRESNERTRRDISGAGGDLSDGYGGLDMVRRKLEEAGEHMARALALTLGARKALDKATGIVDRPAEHAFIAADPLEPVGPKNGQPVPEYLAPMTPAEAKELQKVRNERVSTSGLPWASQEIHG
jgi:hypothetical protein